MRLQVYVSQQNWLPGAGLRAPGVRVRTEPESQQSTPCRIGGSPVQMQARSALEPWASQVRRVLLQGIFGAAMVLFQMPTQSNLVCGGTFYVSPTGSDSATGTLESPWKSIAKATEIASGGDRVLVRGGEYDEGEIWIRGIFGQGGSPTNPMTIAAYPGESPLFTNGARPFIVDADGVRVEG